MLAREGGRRRVDKTGGERWCSTDLERTSAGPGRRPAKTKEEWCSSGPRQKCSVWYRTRASRSSTSGSSTCRVSCNISRFRPRAHGGRVRGRLRVRRIVDPGIPRDPGVGHVAHGRPQHRRGRPLPRAPHTESQLLRPRPGDARRILANPRYVASKAEAYLGTTGLADTCYFGPEASSSSSTTSGTPKTNDTPSTKWTRSKGTGTRAQTKGQTSGQDPPRGGGTSRFLRQTTSRTCGPR